MKKKADTTNGWIMVANDLMQALARSEMIASEATAIFWLMTVTYGRKTRYGRGPKDVAAHKDVKLHFASVARDVGADRTTMRRAFNELLRKKIVKVTRRGCVGFNTDITQWPTLRGEDYPMGLPQKAWASQPMGQDDHGRPSPILEAQTHQKGGLGRPSVEAGMTSPPPDGGPVRARANLGDMERRREGEDGTAPPSPPPATATAYHQTLQRFGQMAQAGRWYGHDPAYRDIEQLLSGPDGWKHQKDLDRLEAVYDAAIKRREQERIDEAHELHMKDVRDTEARLALEAKSAAKGKRR